MNKEVFIEEKRKINEELISLRNRESELITKYIESNKEFSKLQKVNVTDSNGIVHPGFISRVILSYSGNIEYEVLKEKKDGTPSQHKIYLWRDYKISSRT